MTAFLGISVWITLATVIPGLMTIAAVSGAFLLISPYISGWGIDKELVGWSTPAFLITVMVLTQTTGILLENIQVNNHLLGRKEFEVTIPAGIDPLGETSITIRPYDEYRGLYLLLAELRNDEDSQGHLQRCIAQFFLTTNSIISFVAGIITTLALIILSHGPRTVPRPSIPHPSHRLPSPEHLHPKNPIPSDGDGTVGGATAATRVCALRA